MHQRIRNGSAKGEERKKGTEKIFKERIAQNSPSLPKFATHQRSIMDSKQDKYKEIHIHTHHSKNVEREKQEEKNDLPH